MAPLPPGLAAYQASRKPGMNKPSGTAAPVGTDGQKPLIPTPGGKAPTGKPNAPLAHPLKLNGQPAKTNARTETPAGKHKKKRALVTKLSNLNAGKGNAVPDNGGVPTGSVK